MAYRKQLKYPNFYDDCINLGLKNLNYLLDKQNFDELDLTNPLVSHSHLASQYKIANYYIQKKIN